jgi:radical SAM superfamily enzyme YgiQ (UPF0313 family)
VWYCFNDSHDRDNAGRKSMIEHTNTPSRPTTDTPKRAADINIWLADLTYTQQQVSAELIPYAVGLIASFVESRIDLARPIRLFKYPEKLIQALEEDGVPDIIGFSHFIWNGYHSLEFARHIKRMSPDTIIVFGGVNYPAEDGEREAFLRAHPEIDFHVVKEGESAFLKLLEALIDTNMDKEAVRSKIPSVHSIGRDGKVWLTNQIDRMRDLDSIPSPYLEGRLDEFFDGTLLPILQVRRGCPFSCTFCVEGDGFYNKVISHSSEKIGREMTYIGEKMLHARGKSGRNDLSIADSNFGMFKEDIDIGHIIAKTQKDYGFPDYVHVATGKNNKHRVLEVAGLVNGALRLSGSVQTLDPTAMEIIKRKNIDSNEIVQLAVEGQKIEANSYSEVILGLPGETKEGHHNTLRVLMEAGFNRVITYQLMMLPGTELASQSTIKQYGLQIRYRVLPRCFGHYMLDGHRCASAEIESISVANDALSFDDYLECRRLHLMISIFHNDAVFGALLKFLKSLGLSAFRWMELLRDARPEGRLKVLLDQFMEETSSELWEDRETLEAFVRQPGVIERYISGELGNNLMLTYKALGMTDYLAEVAELARTTATLLLRETGNDTAQNIRFMEETISFDACKMSNIWREPETRVKSVMNFDIPRFMHDPDFAPPAKYLLNRPSAYHFVLDESQVTVINRFLSVFGRDAKGIARALSKTYTKKLLRKPVHADEAEPQRQSVSDADRSLGASEPAA